jgi:ubiquinone/menaquinone biosynthesis C-methylase UbiE
MSDQSKKKPLAYDAYELLAEAYAAKVDTKPHNAYYERPTTLSLLPEVRDKRVLDAGCGPGVYTEWLTEHGAKVTAIDASDSMVQLARKRLGDRAEIILANLDMPLDFLEDESFDMVLSPLVLDYVEDWNKTFKEFHRVLKKEGHLVFSVGHPFAEYLLHKPESYFTTEAVEYTWRGFGFSVRMPYYRRPLGKLTDSLAGAGFVIERIVEPFPSEEFKLKDPEHYEKLCREPGFMCVRAMKREN